MKDNMPMTSLPTDGSEINPTKLLAYRVLTFSQQLYRGIELVLERELSLSVRQWRVLLLLANAGPQSSQDIASFWRYDKSQVSRAVAELTAIKLVSSCRSTKDARRLIISLTSQGRKVYSEGLPLSLARQEELTSSLETKELQDFEHTLDVLTKKAHAMLNELNAK